MTELPNTIIAPTINSQFKTGNNLKLSDFVFENFRKLIYDSCGIYFQDNNSI